MLIVQVTYILVSQKMAVLQNIVLIQTIWILNQEKAAPPKKKLTDSDTERENETHSTGEDFTGVTGVTIERNN